MNLGMYLPVVCINVNIISRYSPKNLFIHPKYRVFTFIIVSNVVFNIIILFF